jgi:protein JSN1
MLINSTMPSSLQDASQRYAAPSETSPSNLVIPNQSAPLRTSALSPAYPTTPTSRPTLRHTASSAANLETPVPANGNRHRSGSLTLPQPPANLGSAFSSSPFSSTWLSNPGPARSPLAPTDPSDESEDLSSFSPSADGPVNDELNFSTLAHLGLTDGQELPPASVSGMREQAQRAIANNGPASRHRASTLSNFNRPIRPSITTTSSSASYYNESEEAALARAIGELGMYDDSGYDQTGGYLSAGYGNPAHRPRATTIGALDNPHRRALAPHGYLSSIPQSPVQGGYMQSLSMTSAYGYPPRSRSDRDLTRSRDSSSSRGPRLSISSHTSRAGTPDANGTSTPQMPTRSLWIGNLDVNATSEALLHVFAPYGAIESVRMLPEKVSTFPMVSSCTAYASDVRLCELHGERRRRSGERRCSQPTRRSRPRSV